MAQEIEHIIEQTNLSHHDKVPLKKIALPGLAKYRRWATKCHSPHFIYDGEGDDFFSRHIYDRM